MSDLYSIVGSIQPTQQDILEAELLAKQILEAQFPDLDLREGTGIRDLVLRPSAFILALCKAGFDSYFSQNTLAGLDDNSPQSTVDGLLSNLFLTRNVGSYSVINARMYFARSKSVTFSTTDSFSVDGSLLFFPAENITIPASGMSYDSFQNEYYVDIDLVASEKGSNYNISSGSLLYFTNFDPYFLHGEINYLASESTSPETNTQFIARAKSAISTRNLINSPSIISKMTSDLNYTGKISVIGAGVSGMYRDQIKVLGGPVSTLSGVEMHFTDAGSTIQINIPGHPLVVGQYLDIVENVPVGVLLTPLVLRRVKVNAVIDAGNIQVLVPITMSARSLYPPTITVLNDEVFVHQGGTVDVFCSDRVNQALHKYTLDYHGRATVTGPVYEISRSGVSDGDADTVPAMASYSKRYPGHTVESNVTFSQSGDGTITVSFVNHPMSVGRMVNILGWPTSLSSNFYVVSSIVDQNTFKVGRGLPVFTIGSGLTPSLKYVYPQNDLGFSVDQTLTLDFGPSQANRTATMVVKSFSNLDSIQAYLNLSDNRVVCGDYLARGFDIYVLDFNIVVYDEAPPTSGLAATYIQQYLSTLAPGEDLVLSELSAYLITNASVGKLQTPLGVTYYFYTKDLFTAQTGSIVDVLTPETSTSVFVLGNVTTSRVNLT